MTWLVCWGRRRCSMGVFAPPPSPSAAISWRKITLQRMYAEQTSGCKLSLHSCHEYSYAWRCRAEAMRISELYSH